MKQGCCSALAPDCAGCGIPSLSRRSFVSGAGRFGALASVVASASAKETPRQPPPPVPLRVQPVFVNAPRTAKPLTSWRFSAEIYDETEARQECARVTRELDELKRKASFPLEFLPLARVQTKEQAATLDRGKFDSLLLFAASRNADVLEALAKPDKWNLVFTRRRSGRIYYMYIGLHGHYLRKRRDPISETAVGIDDVVVDDMDEILWRLRALAGLKNTFGKRVVCVGPPGGWGEEGREAPKRATGRWKLDIREITYPELERRIEAALRDDALVKRSRQDAAAYLSRKNVKLETSREAVERSFLLAEIFRQYMHEAGTDAFTISSCMGAVMRSTNSTACLALSVLNDEGYVALCEGDFQAVPTGMLLHAISRKPVFFANPSFPFKGEMLFSHCTAPSKWDGNQFEPVRLLTHYESDFGAATKVDVRKGTKLTAIDPDFEGKRLLGTQCEVTATPFYPVCRTQLEVAFRGDTGKLAQDIRGWHWLLCHGDYLRETAYAARKAGLEWAEV